MADMQSPGFSRDLDPFVEACREEMGCSPSITDALRRIFGDDDAIKGLLETPPIPLHDRICDLASRIEELEERLAYIEGAVARRGRIG